METCVLWCHKKLARCILIHTVCLSETFLWARIGKELTALVAKYTQPFKLQINASLPVLAGWLLLFNRQSMRHALVPSSSLETSPLPLMSSHSSSAKAQRNQNQPNANRGRCIWGLIVWRYVTFTNCIFFANLGKNKKYHSSNHRNIGLGDTGRLRSIIEAKSSI